MSRVSIIGSGYVGRETGLELESIGHEVIFHDIDKNRLQLLKSEGHNITEDVNEAVQNTDVTYITVNTPTIDNRIDLSQVAAASESVGKALKNKKVYHLIVVRSTVVPTTTENLVKPILEKASGKICGKDFGLCNNPEFITEFDRTTSDKELREWYVKNRENYAEALRMIIGEFDKKSGDMLENLIKHLLIPIFRVDLGTAELIKYAANINLAMKISFWNEIFRIANKLGIDSNVVAKIVSLDKRIGAYGIVHGKAFGGKCLPKDLKAIISFSNEQLHYKPLLLEAVDKINEEMARDFGIRS
jgi:UDPglucose 6-dehydrogenase